MNSTEAHLRERIADLEEQSASLKQLVAGAEIWWKVFPFTGNEAKVFSCLMRRELASCNQILDWMYLERPNEESGKDMVRVMILKVRNKLKPFGIDVRTVWGQGYAIDPANKSKINALLTSAQAAE